jgi:N,N-dimethylformamidase
MSEVGEGDLALSAEHGGIWRDLGRPPQQLVGVGFIAEGLDGAVYRILPGVRDGRAGFLVRGVEGDVVGASGTFGTAVGQEIDRSDPERGTPPHAIVVARSTGHTAEMVYAIEEMRPVDPDISHYLDATYSELVFFETPAGGAVFSAGSMAWVGSLRTDAGVSTITRNALDRMRDPAPFVFPDDPAPSHAQE